MYHYQAFGIPIVSAIELPALLPAAGAASNPVNVCIGKVPAELSAPGIHADGSAYCNANEMIYTVNEKIKFYIAGGRQIIIEPISANYQANLIYFYSNCLAAMLYQRNQIPFHVSGVFTGPGKVALFAAPSGTGKSTLALKLQELGHRPFTDDTAVLYIENGKCFARASYPMIRLWQNTLRQQALLGEEDKQQLYEDDEWDKFGFSFHRQFAASPVQVEQIIFLEKEGDAVKTAPVKPMDAFVALSNNVYRCHWIPAMGKSKLQFTLISNILAAVPNIRAIRPEKADSFEDFAMTVKKIL